MKHDKEYLELLHMHIYDEITPHMISLMQTAIGFERSNVKHGIYHAYRNYFYAPAPVDEWEKLVNLGIADGAEYAMGITYWITKAGYVVLEAITDVDIREMIRDD